MAANFGHVGVVFNVVIAVRQGEAALVNVGDHHIRVVQVRLAVKIKQWIRADHVYTRNRINEALLVLYGSDAVQFGLERFQSFGINRLLVHA